MTPAAFRALPKHEQVEMLSHRREFHLRKDHAEHVQAKESKLEAERKSKPTGNRSRSSL